jgi:DNA-binding transcriptional LysR family regulator
MELRHLRYFVAVVEELHFRKAAEKLHIVQPALSKQIKSLESELGILLLDRDRRNVTLTDPGRAFYEEAVAILARAEIAKSRAIATSNGLSGQLSIGFIQPVLAGLLQRTIRAYREHYPAIRLRAVEGSSRDGLQRTVNREVDCAFVRLPVDRQEGLMIETVAREDVWLAVPSTHRLAAQDDIALEELADEEFILIERHLEPSLHDYYISQCNEAGFSPRVGQVVGSTWAVLGLVAGGLGVGFAAESTRYAGRSGVTFRRIRGTPPRLVVGLIWRESAPPPVLENFLSLRPWEKPSERGVSQEPIWTPSRSSFLRDPEATPEAGGTAGAPHPAEVAELETQPWRYA